MGDLWGDKPDPWPPTLWERFLWSFDSFEVCFRGLAGLSILACLILGWSLVLWYAAGGFKDTPSSTRPPASTGSETEAP